MACFGFASLAAGQVVPGQGRAVPLDEEVPSDLGEDFRGLHLPSDRTASRGLAMAAESIEAGQYSQAVRFLDRLLAEEEDAFADLRLGATHVTGLKAEARRLLASLPTAARENYVATYGATARKRLEAGIQAGDLAEIQRVARQFFHTPAGYEASLILALQERDMGRPLSAAVLLQELVDTDQAAVELGPQLWILAAAAWRDAGQPEHARGILEKLKDRSESASFTIAGRPAELFSSGQDPLDWLDTQIGAGSLGPDLAQEHWTTFRGNAARNGTASGGEPHMQVRWKSRVTNLPRLEELLASLRRGYQRKGTVVLPATNPIAVGNVVIMRTADRLVGVDFESGRLVWDVRPEPDEDFRDLMASSESSESAESTPELARAFEQRMWDDAVYGTLSSDGRRVYAVRGLSLSVFDEDASIRLGGGFRFGMRGGGEQDEAVPTNILTALDLEAEGKRAWEINGADVGGKLSGAFFLGPPLCVDGRLYVLAEIKSSVYLVVLRTTEARPYWELEWVQQLANLEIGIHLDPARRLAGAMPSFRGGVLVCPTSAGVVVAVDVTKRSLLWAYRYGVREQDLPATMTFRGIEDSERLGMRTDDRWVDSTAVLTDGKVLLTPRESAELHCLDLATGELLWKRDRGRGLFLAGVHDGTVAIVGTDRVEAIRLPDGKQAWENDHIRLPDDAGPSGRGFLSGGQYFLPLNSGEVIAIDLAGGTIVSNVRSRQGQVLGNLVAHRGAILAQSEMFLEKYDQKDAFRERTEATLAANPDDPTALRNLGELALSDGNTAEAVRLLKRSFQNDPVDDQTQLLLMQALLQGLEDDFSLYREELPLAERIALRPDDRAQLARVTAEGYHASGDMDAALERYLRLVELDAADPRFDSLGPAWESRTSRWIRAQLAELWQSASPEARQSIQRSIREHLERVGERVGGGDLLTQLDYFGGLPSWRAERLRAAERLVELRPGLEAELMLLSLGRSASEEKPQLDELRAKLLAKADRDAGPPQHRWPIGRVVAHRESLDANEQHDRFQAIRVEGPIDPSLEGYRVFFDEVQESIVVLDSYGEVERSVPLNSSGSRRLGLGARGRCHATLLGHLLVVSLGERMMAIDLLERSSVSADLVLWEAETVEAFEGLASRMGNPYLARQDIGQRAFGAAGNEYAIDDAGRPLGWIGPATPSGVVFQAQGELRCVDPLSGEIQWVRRDVPPGAALFGDEEYVFALPHHSTEAVVFRADDGKRLGTRAVPGLDEHYATLGRRILRWKSAAAVAAENRELALVDAWTGETLWSRSLSTDTQIRSIENDWIGILDKSGKFELLEIATGKPVLTEQLEPEPFLRRIFILRSSDRIVLVTDTDLSRRLTSGGNRILPVNEADYPIVSGRVYVFDRASGRSLLPVPAEVDRQGLAVAQPVELPILAFVSHSQSRSNQGEQQHISLLVLHKATGAAIERVKIDDATTNRFRIYPDPRNRNTVLIDMANHRARLEFTEEAAAPEPPIDGEVEGGRKSQGSKGVMGLFFSHVSPTRRGVGELAYAGTPR